LEFLALHLNRGWVTIQVKGTGSQAPEFFSAQARSLGKRVHYRPVFAAQMTEVMCAAKRGVDQSLGFFVRQRPAFSTTVLLHIQPVHTTCGIIPDSPLVHEPPAEGSHRY